MPFAALFAVLLTAQPHRPMTRQPAQPAAVGSPPPVQMLPGPPAPPPPPRIVNPPLPAFAVAARPLLSLIEYITDDDYPFAAIRAGEHGVVAARLYVSADGTPVGCMIAQSSGSAALDEATCRIVRVRSRFVAARGAQGQAVPDVVSFRIRWVLPAETPEEVAARHGQPPPALTGPTVPSPNRDAMISPEPPDYFVMMQNRRAHPLQVITELIGAADYPPAARAASVEGEVFYALGIGPDGHVTSCTIRSPGPSAELEAATCQLLTARARYEPAHTPDGQPIADTNYGMVVWHLPQ